MDIDPLFVKNGWEKKMDNLLSLESPIKESRVIGKEVRAQQNHLRLMKLDAMGANVVASILPDDI